MRAQRQMPRWVAFLVTALALVLVLRPEPARQFESIGTVVFEPVELGLTGMIAQVEGVVTAFQRVAELSHSNEQLREEVDRLESKLVRMRELELENRELRELLRLRQEAGPSVIIPVSKMASDASLFVQSIKIDRGRDDGVHERMAVVTSAGLVGRVARVEAGTAMVLLITDVNSSLTARLQPAEGPSDTGDGPRATGTVRGFRTERDQGARPILVMQHIPQDVQVGMGDVVLTSNLSGDFPEGIRVGRVVQTRRTDSDPLQEAFVEPAVDVNRLERMYVVAQAPARGQ